jgi:hypothetical protein
MKAREPDWVEDSRKTNAALFSELDVLLRALDRFFSLEYLPAPKELTSTKNFTPELEAARDTIIRVLDVLETVIPEDKRNAYWFQKFAETKFLSDLKRDHFREELFRQDSPGKSLYLLYDSFINLKTLLADLTKTNDLNYMSFKNAGNLICKQVRENLFFNPFRHDVDPEFDRIENREVSAIVRNIEDREMRKTLSTVFLHLFRFLRYMRHMNFSTPRMAYLHASLLILLLLRSEIDLFRIYLEKVCARLSDRRLRRELETLSYQFAMESKRVFLQELKDILDKKSHRQLRGAIENSHGILKNLTEQAIIQTARFLKPGLQDEDVFEIFNTKMALSLKLREDVHALHRFLSLMGRDDQPFEKKQEILISLLNFMEYFESFTFRLLRYDDYEEFSAFFNDIKAACRKGGEASEVFDRCSHFKIFLETTLKHIGNRGELKGRPLDVEHVEDIIRQYISTN